MNDDKPAGGPVPEAKAPPAAGSGGSARPPAGAGARPDVPKPATSPPDPAAPGTGRPGAAQPGAARPGAAQPATAPAGGAAPWARPGGTQAPPWEAQPGKPFNAWPERVWPVDRAAAAPAAVLAAALGAGLVGAAVLRLGVVGIGWVLAAVAVLAVAFGTRRRRPDLFQIVAAVGTIALFAVGAVRSAGWLFFLCLATAWALGSLALVGGRTWTGMFVGTFAPWFAQVRALGWNGRGLAGLRSGEGRPAVARALAVGAVTAVLVLVFGALFAGADAAFAELVGGLLPEWEVADVIYRAFLFVLVTGSALTAATLAHQPPKFDELAPGQGKPLPRWEWAVPLAVLDALFLTFVIVQLPVLTGGRQHVLDTSDLTYAEYARQGFWQLCAVTVLTLVVVAVAVRKVNRDDRADRLLSRVLLGALCVLALVIVASALRRMSLYVDEFGLTRLRIFVSAVELWLGVVFVLVLVAGWALRAKWLPRAVVGTGVVVLLGLAAINPDAYIAKVNVDRYFDTTKIDVHYLSGLTADATPQIDRLPAKERSCALSEVDRTLADDEPWYQYNRARERARAILADRPIESSRSCPGEDFFP